MYAPELCIFDPLRIVSNNYVPYTAQYDHLRRPRGVATGSIIMVELTVCVCVCDCPSVYFLNS